VSGADALEADLRVFPSFFLMPAPEEELPAASEEATFETELDLSDRGDAKELLQSLVNLLRGAIIATEEKTTKILFSRALCGAPVVTSVKVEQRKLLVTIKSSREDLLGILVKEVQRRK
jgi:hypothetical protein